ncbi:FecCD family ABC transporter permease [Sodalis sp. RH16]|uniref:FecCD family ABC transporter permease n=1 Tax=unclassified Sodalis (in: enterobacteria) TaxID=2636512 RepID=UPI0039B57311
MNRILQRAGLRAIRPAGYSLLLRPAALRLLSALLLGALALLLWGISRGSLPVPVSAIGKALFYPQSLSASQQYIVWDIRLPRLLMALLVGAMLGMAGAAMQSVTGNGLADPGLLGVKEGASVVVLTQILLFPSVSEFWRPLTGMAGGLLAALMVAALARDFSRPRFILTGLGISWIFAAGIGVFITTADARDVQTALVWMAGSLNAATWPLLAIAVCWAVPAAILLFCTARAGDVALLGNPTAIGLGVRLPQLTLLRFIAPVLLTATCVSCVGNIGFVGLMAPHLTRLLMRGGQTALLSGSALVGALLVLLGDSVGRLAFAPLQLPAGIIISLLGAPFFLLLLWQRRDRF